MLNPSMAHPMRCVCMILLSLAPVACSNADTAPDSGNDDDAQASCPPLSLVCVENELFICGDNHELTRVHSCGEGWLCENKKCVAKSIADDSISSDASAEISEPTEDILDVDSPNKKSDYALMNNSLWQPVDPADDPFWPVDDTLVVRCPPESYSAEDNGDGLWFSVSTQECNYLTMTQPLLVDLPEGATVQVQVWHFPIISSSGTYHHLVAGGDPVKTIWEVTLELPALSAGFLPYEPITSTVSISQGEPLYWHLSNHGNNSWHLIELKATY